MSDTTRPALSGPSKWQLVIDVTAALSLGEFCLGGRNTRLVKTFCARIFFLSSLTSPLNRSSLCARVEGLVTPACLQSGQVATGGFGQSHRQNEVFALECKRGCWVVALLRRVRESKRSELGSSAAVWRNSDSRGGTS